jgi:beta-barrel assembly-enhancing protease
MNQVSRRRRGRMDMRLVIALIIAVVGIVSFLGKRSTNPVTGENQYVDLSPKQEIALGLEAAPQMAQQMGGTVPLRDPRAAMVDEVGKHLVRNSDAAKPEDPYRESFGFHLLNDDKTINAFALPGGQIFITAALYGKMQNEAQLAGVLGHEMGHVIGRHASEHMAKGKLGAAIATAVGVGASDERGRGMGAAVAAQMANQLIQLRFGRKDESESDNWGLRYMAQAGYDPRAMLGVMEILRDASKGGRQPEWMSSHPLPENRLTEIEQRVKEMFPNGVPKELSEGRPLR